MQHQNLEFWFDLIWFFQMIQTSGLVLAPYCMASVNLEASILISALLATNKEMRFSLRQFKKQCFRTHYKQNSQSVV